MSTNSWLYSFNDAARELCIYNTQRMDFHAFVGANLRQPLKWWRDQYNAYRRALAWAEDARDERETMADALV